MESMSSSSSAAAAIPAKTNMNTSTSSTSGGGREISNGSLDTALLETIFYNEMMLMGGNGSSSLSSDFMAYLSTDPTSSTTPRNVETAPADASAIAERALLSDFGVRHSHSNSNCNTRQSTNASTLPPPLSPTALQQPPIISYQHQNQEKNQQQQHQHQQQQPLEHGRSQPTMLGQRIPEPQLVRAQIPLPGSQTNTYTNTNTNTQKIANTQLLGVLPPSTTIARGAPSAAPPSVPQERAKQLVSQFATLASRLGVVLPPNLLQSLTTSTAINEAKRDGGSSTIITNGSEKARTQAEEACTNNNKLAVTGAVAATTGLTVDCAATSSSRSQVSTPSPTISTSGPIPPLAHSAEAAIASVLESRKRAAPDGHEQQHATSKLYSKRRKKPRLSDCESRLSQLQADNAMLKRHVDNVTNKSNKFLQERKQAEMQLRKLSKEGAGKEQINPVIHKFSENYSDYGRHRNQELTFHLEQLERLAAPTNFTKMGLWSLGQNEGFYTNPKQNPIAGILRKELGVTPAQGRKIIEKRQKIQALCANLKDCVALLGKLKILSEGKQKVFNDRMSKCQEILTPHQVAKLMVWVGEHSDTLEAVCPGWGSEQIREKQGKETPSSPPPPPPAPAAPPAPAPPQP